MHDPAVENVLDFELFMVINDLGWRGRSRVTTRERIRRREGELSDGKDRMVATHGEGELELVCAMTYVRCDFEGAKLSMGEFRGRSGGSNIARVKPDLVAGL